MQKTKTTDQRLKALRESLSRGNVNDDGDNDNLITMAKAETRPVIKAKRSNTNIVNEDKRQKKR